jgi:monoamine oxidase
VVYGGYGALLAKNYATPPLTLALTLALTLDTEVLAITEGKPAQIRTSKGDFTAKYVILTVPIGVLQQEKLKIPAQASFQKALNGLAMGALSKVVFALDETALPNKNEARLIDTHEGAVIAFDIRPYNSNLVIASFGGDFARQFTQPQAQDVYAYLQQRLSTCLGEPIKIKQQLKSEWWESPFSRGSYAYVTPKNQASRQLIREPIRENIFYAGEASALEASMTVGGATLEGARIAQKIASYF